MTIIHNVTKSSSGTRATTDQGLRKRKYSVCVQGWHNSGMGWEITPYHLDDNHGGGRLTRDQADDVAAARNVYTTDVRVYDDYGEVLAMAGRGENKLTWFI